jgi:hypothetical protein
MAWDARLHALATRRPPARILTTAPTGLQLSVDGGEVDGVRRSREFGLARLMRPP